MTTRAPAEHYDVVILGAGLAGLTLARHLLLDSDKTILLLERRAAIPPPRQKVGESSVQLAGYYFAKVLDLERYLLHDQLMKYNLRFYWKSAGRANDGFEDYGQGYIRNFSNIASYQLDRNTLEGELLRLNRRDRRFTFHPAATDLAVDLATDGGRHGVRFRAGEAPPATVTADWVVDATGRGRFLARRMGLRRRNPIRHGAFFWWVEGLVDVDKLTGMSPRERRLNPDRAHTGHLPFWLATNHFCDEGLWFWVIPLRHKTSLGLVYDNRLIDSREVFSVEKATRWVCERFPLFARDLPQRKVLDFGGLKDFSHDCGQTISAERWAMAGEAGRFTDPLYSPGSDLIAIYNTLIVDAVKTGDRQALDAKCRLYEQLMRAVYQAYVPTYATSYDALGDQETFSLKYVWELTVYFAGYVFPFINDLFTDRRFALAFMRLFTRLGPINQGVQDYLSDFYQWKKKNLPPPPAPIFFDFSSLAPLRTAEKTFYRVGVSVSEAKAELARQVENLEELARFVAARVASVVVGDAALIRNRRFVAGIDVAALRFDPAAIEERWARCRGEGGEYPWSFDPAVMEVFDRAPQPALEVAEAVAEEVA